MTDVCPCNVCPWDDSCETCDPTTCELFFNEQDKDEEYDYDPCFECSGYGDDWFINDHGELESSCLTCPFDCGVEQ